MVSANASKRAHRANTEEAHQGPGSAPRHGVQGPRAAAGQDLYLVYRHGVYVRRIKPALDRVGAVTLLIALAPIIAVIALAIYVRLGRPLLYRQVRVGRGGRPFEMLKFRTMLPDRRRNAGSPYRGHERRRTHKTLSDPRHTRLGRFLRRWSLDELPQLWNVARGDLSLIGPRPEMMVVVDRYESWQHRRHVVKPGLTGLWQVTERDEHGRMHLHVDTDLRYVDGLSFLLDAWILVMTVPAVCGVRVRPRGPAKRRDNDGLLLRQALAERTD